VQPVNLTQAESDTITWYDTHPDRWGYAHTRDEASKDFHDEPEKFRNILPAGKLLEVGCGNGRQAQEFLDFGYEYVGVDASEGLLSIAREKNPTGTFSLQNVYSMDFPDLTFDGFWANAILLHIPRERLEDALKEIHRVINVVVKDISP
jgi:ubiquinone/menaquinone biosynthesis C-methylase UbiE